MSDSDEFVRLWSRWQVSGKSLQQNRFAYPDIGGVTLNAATVPVPVPDEKSEQGRL